MSEEKFEQILNNHEKIITRVLEVLSLKRIPALVATLAFVWGLFGFAYQTKAGFFASVCLILSAVYIVAILYSYFGEWFDKIFFPELEDRTGVPTIKEIAAFLAKHSGEETTFHKLIQMGPTQRYIIAGVCFVLAIVFKFIKPFWFNFVVVTVAILAGPVYVLIKNAKNAPKEAPAPKAAPKEESAPAPVEAPKEEAEEKPEAEKEE